MSTYVGHFDRPQFTDVLRAGGVDTAAGLAACCTLRQKSVQDRGKSAGWRPAKLRAVDATAASLSEGEMQSMCRYALQLTDGMILFRGGIL